MPGALFDPGEVERSPALVAPGAFHVPNFLTVEEQVRVAKEWRSWCEGPVPPHSTLIAGHPMSVSTVGLGWHWRAQGYSRCAPDVNGARVLDFPAWLGELSARGVFEVTGDERLRELYSPDVALANYYPASARMGMHQDKDEASRAPVVSLSIGCAAKFRFGNTESRNRPWVDVDLHSGDLFVFGWESRLAFHGVMKILPDTSPDAVAREAVQLADGRLNITVRQTGFE